jgi:predicted O-linked N-acetylglucosamine transferase (SPINDLY family)
MNTNEILLNAIEEQNVGNINEAVDLYLAALNMEPNNTYANHNLGILIFNLGEMLQALPFLEKAYTLDKNNELFKTSYEEAKEQLKSKYPIKENSEIEVSHKPSKNEIDTLFKLYKEAKYDEAFDFVSMITKKFPNYGEGFNILGSILSFQGKKNESIDAFRIFLNIEPNNDVAYFNLALALKEVKNFDEAIKYYKESILINPNKTETFLNLGLLLLEVGNLKESANCFNIAISLEPNCAKAYSYLGSVLKDIESLDAAIECFKKAISLDLNFTEAYSNLLFNLNYSDSFKINDSLEIAKKYGNIVSEISKPKFTSWKIKSNKIKLRIGFVSGDFRNHPVGYFVEGLFKYIDKNLFEIIAFPTTSKSDELTDRIKPLFNEWLPIYGLNDFDAAKLIHTKSINILVDLAGHSSYNRLCVFSYKPAPIQISWLGYFNTTGIPEMDYFIGDPYLSPKCENHYFTETIWNLPDTWLCMNPPKKDFTISILPALKNGYITFGCFGNLTKINNRVIKIWAKILIKIPNSKLFLKSKQFNDSSLINKIENEFYFLGIRKERLILESPSSSDEYFNSYNKIDIVLDTFPYPGGTTSVDAIWMGVPVLTLKGDRFLSHLGESIAYNSDQENWIANDEKDYINKAITYSSNLKYLSELKNTLRISLLKTPLFDTKRFVKNFEIMLIEMSIKNKCC